MRDNKVKPTCYNGWSWTWNDDTDQTPVLKVFYFASIDCKQQSKTLGFNAVLSVFQQQWKTINVKWILRKLEEITRRGRELRNSCVEYNSKAVVFIGVKTLEGSKRALIGRPLETLGRRLALQESCFMSLSRISYHLIHEVNIG